MTKPAHSPCCHSLPLAGNTHTVRRSRRPWLGQGTASGSGVGSGSGSSSGYEIQVAIPAGDAATIENAAGSRINSNINSSGYSNVFGLARGGNQEVNAGLVSSGSGLGSDSGWGSGSGSSSSGSGIGSGSGSGMGSGRSSGNVYTWDPGAGST